MTWDHRQSHLESVRGMLSLVVYPLQFIVNLPATSGRWFRESLATRRELQEQNASLHTQQLLFKARLQKLESLESENIRLRELLDSSFQVDASVLVAELMAVDLDPYKHQVGLNKGDVHEIYIGQPVLDGHGVMGQIVHVSLVTSIAMLITDPDHAIPVQVNRSGLRTIALGTGSLHHLELRHIPNNADIRPGDLLTTSGLGGTFPPGYPVAEITSVVHDPGQSFALVTATPRAHLDRSREVLLVRRSKLTTFTKPANETEILDPAVEIAP